MPDLDAFVAIVKTLPDKSFARLKLCQLETTKTKVSFACSCLLSITVSVIEHACSAHPPHCDSVCCESHRNAFHVAGLYFLLFGASMLDQACHDMRIALALLPTLLPAVSQQAEVLSIMPCHAHSSSDHCQNTHMASQQAA